MLFTRNRRSSGKTSPTSQVENLELSIDGLEPRMMLAVDVDFGANGDTIKITGDDASDDILVFKSVGGNIVVQVNGVVNAPINGSATLKSLNVKLGDGGDTLTIDNGVEVTGKTVVKLGNAGVGEENRLDVQGDYNKLKVIGGSGADEVVATGIALASSKTVIKLKGGEDLVGVEIQMNIVDFGFIDILVAEAPKVKVNLGAGNDVFTALIGGSLASTEQIESIVDIVAASAIIAELAGISIPQVISLNGGAGDDIMSPLGLLETIETIGNVKSFEIIGDLTDL